MYINNMRSCSLIDSVNPNIKHKTGQIAMDGSQLLQRAVDPPDARARRYGQGVMTLIAGWLHYVINTLSGQSTTRSMILLQCGYRPKTRDVGTSAVCCR